MAMKQQAVVLDCGDGVALSGEGTSFYIALPPVTFTEGFSFVVTDSEGKVQTFSSTKEQTIRRNTILNMPAVAYEGEEPNYMTFVSEGSSTLSLEVSKTQDVTRSLQYSFDTVNWSDWTLSGTSYEQLTFTSGSPLYLRGSNPNGLCGLNASGEQSIGDYVTFKMDGSNVECEGDVMALLNYETVPTEIPNTYCFYQLFAYCTNLVSAPKLGATTLKANCYGYMFYGDTALTTAPELPAQTLETGCYEGMFASCSSLNYVKASFSATPSDTYTNYWLYGTASTGTFVAPNSSSWGTYTRGVSTIPEGWTIVTE